jgi:hypothetical protein
MIKFLDKEAVTSVRQVRTSNERAIKNETRLYEFRQGQPGLRYKCINKNVLLLNLNSDLIRKFKLKQISCYLNEQIKKLSTGFLLQLIQNTYRIYPGIKN